MLKRTLTISLEPAMRQEVEEVSRQEHRTHSELVREALRAYFTARRQFPIYNPTAAELRAIEKGRAALRRGDFDTLDDLRHVGSTSEQGGRKGSPARPATRKRAATRRV